MPSVKKTAVVTKECVACGCCVKVCPKEAITVYKGFLAIVNDNVCVGCGKCAKTCPADVIELREVKINEKALV